MSNMKSRLPQKNNVDDVNAFISGAEHKTAKNVQVEKTTAYPWDEPGIREDVTKVYNLRLSEPYLLKLKYIAEHTPDSMQKFCLDVVQNAIDIKISALTK